MDRIKTIYKNVVSLRKQVKSNKDAMKYYRHLKEINKNDPLYGWMFDDDAILTDTMDRLDLYDEKYIHDILICYCGELETILQKAVQ